MTKVLQETFKLTNCQSVVKNLSPSHGPRLHALWISNSFSPQASAGCSLPSSPSFALRQVTERYWNASPHFSEQALHGPACHSGHENLEILFLSS